MSSSKVNISGSSTWTLTDKPNPEHVIGNGSWLAISRIKSNLENNVKLIEINM
jgi:hypothetical protein